MFHEGPDSTFFGAVAQVATGEKLDPDVTDTVNVDEEVARNTA